MSAAAHPCLLVDDDASFREVMRFHLEEEGYDVEVAEDGRAALAAFERRPVPVVVTDLKMPRLDGLGLLHALKERSADVLVIVITAFGDMETAVGAMRAGAYDFLPKPCDRDHLKLAVARAFEHAGLRSEVRRLRTAGSEGKDLLYRSESMARLVEMADRIAPSDASVLIQGESGTGKELLARRIHRKSGRSGDLVALNCGGIPRDLLEDELFGHVRGAFTGAARDRKGRFVQADGGTLFLDEIGELPPELQPRLLRVLQERTVDVVGRDTPVPVDVRIVAATARDLARDVADGSFREDLFFRLNVVPLRIPPLRERPEDVLPLADHFLRLHGDGEPWQIPPAAAARLEAHPWPGNVRELDNACQRIALLCEGHTVRADVLTDGEAYAASAGARADAATTAEPVGYGIQLPAEGVSLRDIERLVIVRALEMNGYNRSQTARFLRIPRHVLLYRMDKYDIRVERSAK